MADDGMLLNFELGAEPFKQHIKFKGGRWRDRKRAEKSANVASSPAKAEQEHADGPASPKRRRLNDDSVSHHSDVDANLQPLSSDRRPPGRGDNRPSAPSQEKSHQSDASKSGRQVISSLFSSNPTQRTAVEEILAEWKEPEATNAPSELANFGSLAISSRLVEELAKMNLERPTAIQEKVIPHMLSGSGDAFVQAETGSGKTFSYLLPILHRVLLLSGRGQGKQIHRDSGLFAIIVAPTRELARQTHTVVEQLIRPFPWLVSTAITGGESKKAEKARIRKGVNFLVATPGRLADHIDNTKALSLATTRWLILDEGDRLMDLGFEEDLKKAIAALRKVDLADATADGTSLKALPERRVTVLCSATMKMNVQKLGEMSLADATFLAADKGGEKSGETTEGRDVHRAPAQLHQSYVIAPAKLRLVTLVSYLKSTFARRGHTMKVIIFMSCADSVDFHYELLRNPQKAVAPSESSTDADVTATTTSKAAAAKTGEVTAQPTSKTASSKGADITARTVSKAAYITSPASPEVILHRMHGSLSQPVRTATLRSFSASTLPSLLITTDVSSRGLDIPSVDLVIEYDPAFSFADHIHRVGRTARAGRSGDAMLFLLPGSEEGYIELLKTSAPPTAQSYDAILQKGSLNKMEFPVTTLATASSAGSSHDKAETTQLHFEQRLLADTKLLELGRNGFKSHIRAYATHTKEERSHFDMTQLHLGHMAKSFGLREAPGGIGSGVDRKTRKGAKATERPVADVVREKNRKLMNPADEFNIG